MYEAGSVAVILGGRLNPTGFLEWGKRVAAAKSEKEHSIVLGARDEASGPLAKFRNALLGAREATVSLQTTVDKSMVGVSTSVSRASKSADQNLGAMAGSAKRAGETVLGLGDSYKEMATVTRDETSRAAKSVSQFANEDTVAKDKVLRNNRELIASQREVRKNYAESLGPPGGGGRGGATGGIVPGGAGGTPEQQAVRATDAWKKGFNTLANIGKYTTAAFLGIGAISVKWASDFQRNMTLLQTQAGATNKEMGLLKRGILDLAPAVGFGPTELSKALFHIESAGIHGKNALDVLKLSAEGAKVGMANLEDTTNGLVAIMRSQPKDIHSVSEAMGVMNDIVGRGNLHMEDLVKALGTGIIAAAKNAHLGLRDVGAALDTMTSRGIPAEQAATRLRTTLTLMSNPTAKAQKALETLGITQTQLAQDMQQHGLSYALADLQRHLDKTFPPGRKLTVDQEREAMMKYGEQLQGAGVKGAALQKDLIAFKNQLQATGGSAIKQSQLITEAFGGSRMGTTMALLMQNADDVKKHFNELNQANAAQRFQSAWQKTQKDFGVQTSQLVASVRELGIRIGDWLIPKVKALVVALIDAGKWLGHHKVLLDALAVLFGTILVAAIAAFFGRLGARIYEGLNDIAKFGRAVGGLPGKFADAAKAIGQKLGIIRKDIVETTAAQDELNASGEAGGAAGGGVPGGGRPTGGPGGGVAEVVGGGAIEGMITGVRGVMAPGSQENPLAVVVMASELYGLGARGSAAEQFTTSEAKSAAAAERAAAGSVGGIPGAQTQPVEKAGAVPSWVGQSTETSRAAATAEEKASASMDESAGQLDKSAAALNQAAEAQKTSAAQTDQAAADTKQAAASMDEAAATTKEAAGAKAPLAAPQRTTVGLPPEFQAETRAAANAQETAASAEEKAAGSLDGAAAELDRSAAALRESAAVSKKDSAESSAATKEAAADTKSSALATDQAAGATEKSALATDQAAGATDKAALSTDQSAAATEKASLSLDESSVALDGAAAAQEAAALRSGIPGAGGVPAGGVPGGAPGEAAGLGSKLMRGIGIAGTGLIASQIGGQLIGGSAGSAVSTIGSTASAGAGLGSMVGPWGTAIGAALGAAVGVGIKLLGGHDYGKEVADAVTKEFGPTVDKRLSQDISTALDDAQKVAKKGINWDTGKIELTPQQRDQIRNDMYKAGTETATQLEKGWSQYKFETANQIVSELITPLKKLPPQARVYSIQSIVEFAKGLESQGKLAKGSWQQVLAGINGVFPGWEKQLTGFAATGVRGFTLALNFGKAQANTKRAMDAMRGDFGPVRAAMDATAGNADDKAKAMIAALESIPHKGSSPAAKLVRADIATLRRHLKEDFDAMTGIIDNFVWNLAGVIGTMGQAMGGFLGNLTFGLSSLAQVAAPAIASVTQAVRGGALATPQGVQGLGRALQAFAGPAPRRRGRQTGGFVPGNPHMDNTPLDAAGGELVVTAHGQQMMDSAAPGLVNSVAQNQLPHPQTTAARTNTAATMPKDTAGTLSSVGKASQDVGKGMNTAVTSASRLAQALRTITTSSKQAHDGLSKNLTDANSVTDKSLKRTHDVTNTHLKETLKLHTDFGDKVNKNMYQTFIKGGSGTNEAVEPMVSDAWKKVQSTTQTYTANVQTMMKKSNQAIVSDAGTFSSELTGAHKNMAHSVAQADAQLATSSAGIMAKMDEATFSGVKAVFDEMNKGLSQLSVKGITFAGSTNPGAAANAAIQGVDGLIPFAGGGFLPGSEYGLGDMMTLIDPQGNPRARMAGDEGIFNRHQMPYVDMGLQLLGFQGSEDLWQKVNRPHGYQTGGRLPGFQAGGAAAAATAGAKPATPAGGFWVQTGATIDPTAGQAPTFDAHGGFSFAELLEAGANAGMRPDLTQLLGLPRSSFGMPMETAIDIRMPGGTKSAQIWKNDVGSGQPGNPHYTIDLHQAIASFLGWSPNGDVQVAKAGTDPHAQVVAGSGAAAAASWTPIKQPKWTGPGGAPKEMGDAVLKKITDAANKYGQAHVPILSTGTAAGTFGGGLVPGIASKPSNYFFPFPKGMSFSWQRIDQGQDMEEAPGGPILAIAPGVVSVASDRFGGFGPFYATEQITAGPLAGRGVYYGHTKAVKTGPVSAGEVIAVTQSSANSWTAAPAGWLELGFLPYGSMSAGAAMAPVLHAIFSGNYARGGRLGEDTQPRKMLGDPPTPIKGALRQTVRTGKTTDELRLENRGLPGFATGGRPWAPLSGATGYIPGYRPARVRRGRGGLHVVGGGTSSSSKKGSKTSSHKSSGTKTAVKAPNRHIQPISQNTATVLDSMGLGTFVSDQNRLGTLDNQYSMQENLFNLFDASGGAGLPLTDLDVLQGIREEQWDILFTEWKELPGAIAALQRHIATLTGHKATKGHWVPGSDQQQLRVPNMDTQFAARTPGPHAGMIHIAGHKATGEQATMAEVTATEAEIKTLDQDIKNATRQVATVHHQVSAAVMSVADNFASAQSAYLNDLSAIVDQKYNLTQLRNSLRGQSKALGGGPGAGLPSLSSMVNAILAGTTLPSTTGGNSAAKKAIAQKISALSVRDAALSHNAQLIRGRLRQLVAAKNAQSRKLRAQGFDTAWAITLQKWQMQDKVTKLKDKLDRLKALLKEEQTQIKSETDALTQVQSWQTGGLQGNDSIIQSLGNVGMEILGLYQQGADLPTPGRKEPTLKTIEDVLSKPPPKGLGLTLPAGLVQGVQTATQAYTDFTNFQAMRQSLFSQFGSNFVQAGANPFAGTAGLGAGVQYYGAAAGSSGGPGSPSGFARGGRVEAGPGPGGTTINIENHFAAGPPDPHTWSAGMAHEITAAA